jgi:hypothetical protein
LTLQTAPHKTALITGASSGIGKALAHHFAQDGYHLVLAARGVAKMQALADALQNKLFTPDLLATRGKILNTASTAAFQPGPYMAVYCATKSFVLSFSEAIASELEDTGVTVTALCPGPTASGFQDKADLGNSALVKGKKLPTAEDVAALGYRAMQRGQRVYIPGFVNWAMAQSMRVTPRNLATKVVKTLTRPIA